MGIQFSTDPADKTVYDYIGTSVSNADVTGNKSEYGPNGIQGPGGFLWRKFCDPAYYGSITGTGYEDEARRSDHPCGTPAHRRGGQHRVGRRRPRTRQIPDRPGPRRRRCRRWRVRPGRRSAARSVMSGRWNCAPKDSAGSTSAAGRRATANPVALYKAINGPQYAPAYEHTTSNAKPIIDETGPSPTTASPPSTERNSTRGSTPSGNSSWARTSSGPSLTARW